MPDLTGHDVEERPAVAFGEGDDGPLLGDLYLPADRPEPVPVVLCIHGGGWVGGTRAALAHWGRYLARHGLAAFAIDYRLAKPGAPAFPGVMGDIASAARHLGAEAGDLGLDCDRMAMFGQSAGGHLAALSALGGYDEAPPFEAVAGVRALVVCYGIFDLGAHWRHELVTRPDRSTTRQFLGCGLPEDPRRYFEASPLSYVTVRASALPVLVAFGTDDVVVSHEQQSLAFLGALSQAGNEVRSLALPGAGHYWANEPFDIHASRSAVLAPRLVSFLRSRL